MKRILALALVTASFLDSAAAEPPPAHIQVGRPSADTLNQIIVPSPSEIFAVLSKLDRATKWSHAQRPIDEPVNPKATQAQNALILGTVLGEGFIAAEARDGEQVNKIGKSILNLARALDIDQHAKDNVDALITAADKKDWAVVSGHLEQIKNDLKMAISEEKKPSVARLVALGEWIRIIDAVTAIVGTSYSADGAELLNQQTLLAYFEQQVGLLKPEERLNPALMHIYQALGKIGRLIALGQDVITEGSVHEMNVITADLVRAINSNVP
jgi:hypothetical protein